MNDYIRPLEYFNDLVGVSLNDMLIHIKAYSYSYYVEIAVT